MKRPITVRNHSTGHGAAIVSDMLSGTDTVIHADGILTDGHAACSYGIPVVVIDGQAYGSGDLPGCVIVLIDDHDPATTDLARHAQAAGYILTRPVPGIDYPDF